MAGAGINERAEGKAGHALRPLDSCKEGEFCPHAVHLVLRMEDGTEGNVTKARTPR